MAISQATGKSEFIFLHANGIDDAIARGPQRPGCMAFIKDRGTWRNDCGVISVFNEKTWSIIDYCKPAKKKSK